MAQEPMLRSGQTTAGGVGALPAEVNRVLKNTYLLLALTLAFASATAFLSMSLGLPRLGFLPMLFGFFGLLFAIEKTADSGLGLLFVFLFTGFLGYQLGPIVGYYLAVDGPGLVGSALGMASLAFVGLSGYALVSRKDFSFLGGFLTAGFFVIMGAMLFAWIFDLSGWHMAIAAGIMLFSVAAILYQTSAIVHGGERNYIRATTSLFVSFYNLFSVLLMFMGGGDD